MKTRNLIQSLGGSAKVASSLGLKPQAVGNWQLEGRKIPWKHRPAISRMASQFGVDLPAGFWE